MIKNFISKYLESFFKKTKKVSLEENDKEIEAYDFTVSYESIIGQHMNLLEKNGINCSKESIPALVPIYKLSSNDPNFFCHLNEDIVCFDPYKYNKIMTPKEFAEYVGESNITWKDIIKTLEDNKDIPEKEKSILLRAVKNLKYNKIDKINFDLGVLNYNLKNIKIIYETLEDSSELEIARFVADKHAVYVNEKLLKRVHDIYPKYYSDVLVHEILGHASNIAYLYKDGGIFCSTHFMGCLLNDKKCYGYNIFGQSLDEAIAEYIRVNALEKKLDSMNSQYLPFLYFLIITCNIVGISIDDYINNGLEYLIDKLKEKNLYDGLSCIEFLETKYVNVILGGIDKTGCDLEDLILPLLYNVAYENYKNGMDMSSNRDSIINIINKYYRYIIPTDNKVYIGVNYETLQSLSFDKLKQEVKEYLNEIYTYKPNSYQSVYKLGN